MFQARGRVAQSAVVLRDRTYIGERKPHRLVGFSARRLFSGLIAALMLSACALVDADKTESASNSRVDNRPNIIVVMFDDLGYSDLGAFGGEIDTPNLDQLAKNGVRLTQFYNASRCSPSRASLLTGLYPHRVGLGDNGASMSNDGATVAEILSANGYATAMVGKWHLTRATPISDRAEHLKWLNHQDYFGRPFGDLQTYPVARGFERHYGPIWGVVNFFDPFSLVEGVEAVRDVPEDYYITDAITDKSISYIEEMSAEGKPFFLYMAHTAPHWPIHARPEDKEKYNGQYDDGPAALRDARFARQVKLGLFGDDKVRLPPLTEDAADEPGGAQHKLWAQMNEAEKAYHADKMEAHAAMIDRVDQGIGRLIKTLKDQGLYDNTLILVLSDNGASPEVVQRAGYDRPSETRSGVPIAYGDQDTSLDPSAETVVTGIGPAWASSVNTPWRYWKREPFDGGVHTPFIAHWPKGFKDMGGALRSTPGHVIDIAPTIYDIADVAYPDSYQGRELPPLDGVSLVDAISGGELEERKLFFEHLNGRAVVAGKWKLLSKASWNGEGYKDWQLYDLSEDRAETNDISPFNPEAVKQLASAWQDWATDVGVSPPEKSQAGE